MCGRRRSDSVLLLVLPIAHNLPLACPGIQGYFFQGGKVVLLANTRPEEMFALIEKHGVTHIKVVPALLIRLINDPSIAQFELVFGAADPERRPAHAARGAAAHPPAHPATRFVQENFGMSGGHADVRARSTTRRR